MCCSASDPSESPSKITKDRLSLVISPSDAVPLFSSGSRCGRHVSHQPRPCYKSVILSAVSRSPAREGEQCEFSDGTVGRCEKLVSCLEANGVATRDDNFVMCDNGNNFGVVACCRRPHWIAEAMCSVWAKYWLEETPEASKTCTTTKPLISGGKEAGLGEFPNMAAVGFGESEDNIVWECGGSLITPSFVLTAAHCIIRSDMWVGLGEQDLNGRGAGTLAPLHLGMPEGLAASESREPTLRRKIEQRIKVNQAYIYPEYQKTYHDIALLRLQYQAELTNRVLPACLPKGIADRYTSDTAFTVVGWGYVGFKRPLESSANARKLQKVTIGHLGPIRCLYGFFLINAARHLPLGITSDLICAGSPGMDACEGDSGGPLMQKAQLPSDAGPCQPQMVVGVVGSGPEHCPGLGIYTRVSSYIDWITGIVAPKLLPVLAK